MLSHLVPPDRAPCVSPPALADRLRDATVAQYRAWAERQGLLAGALPEPAVLAALVQPAPHERPPQDQSLVEPFREQVLRLHQGGVEGQAIWQLLVGRPTLDRAATSGERLDDPVKSVPTPMPLTVPDR